jgi:hypothetical protein
LLGGEDMTGVYLTDSMKFFADAMNNQWVITGLVVIIGFMMLFGMWMLIMRLISQD